MLMYILLFVLFIVVLHIYFRYNHEAYLINKIKGPKLCFLFGNVFNIVHSQEEVFSMQLKWHEEFGDIYRLTAFNKRAVFISKPQDIEKVLSSSRYIQKEFPYMFLYGWLGEGLLTSNGKKWHHRRKLLTPAFHFVVLKKFFGIICEHTTDLMNSIRTETEEDNTEIVPLISKHTLRVICETSMGISIREENKRFLVNRYFTALKLLGEYIVYRAIRLWLFNDFIYKFSKTSKLENQVLNDLHTFTTKVIQERRKLLQREDVTNLDDNSEGSDKNKFAMLDMLLDEERKGNIDEAGIREEVDTFMFEGHDTMSKAISFMIMRIANESEIQDKIYEELKTVFSNSQEMPTLEDLTKLKYLECCIKESLRIYPSVPFFSRYIVEETKLGGYIVPKNTFCNINIFQVHRNPEIFSEPERFIPERFLPKNLTKIHPYAYIPFSAGARNCIGQKFAMMEMKTIMSALLWNYKLEPVTKPEDIVFQTDLVLATRDPLYVRFRQRNNT